MRVSKYIKVNKNILVEYVYDTDNNIPDSYKVLLNLKDNVANYSYISGGSLAGGQLTNNELGNQLFKLDSVNNIYGLLDENNYSFLQFKDYNEGFPARHDTLTIHLPTNYTFGEYIGFHVRVYTFDYNNRKTYDLSNFYYDSTDLNQQDLLQFTQPPLYFQETVWGKQININFPSVAYLSNLRNGNDIKADTINYNLTNGAGLSTTSPVFIDFHFIRSKKTINSVVTYTLTSRTPFSVPQNPDYEKLGLRIEHSKNGDFFEIFGIYNGTLAEFNTFMENSFLQGKKFRVEYDITVFEQNVRGKTSKTIMTENFNEKIEYRPIIKFSTTTAIIDVVMNIIDDVDSSSIQRRASYGMLQDEISKYSLSLTKINLEDASKPKIYNIKNAEGAGLFGNLNGSAYSDGRLYGNAGGSLFSTNTAKNLFGLGRKGRGSNIGTVGISNETGISQISDQSRPQVILEPYPVDRLVLADRFSVLTKSENVLVGARNFYGIGKLQIVLYSFDNIIQLNLAKDVTSQTTGVTDGAGVVQTTNVPQYLDLTSMGEIKMTIKNQSTTLEFPLYTESQAIDLTLGQIVIRIPASRMAEVRKVYDSGVNIFYITATNNSLQSVIYSGLYTIYDTPANIQNLNDIQAQVRAQSNSAEPIIVTQVSTQTQATAIITRRIVSGVNNGGGLGTGPTQSGGNNLTNSSLSQQLKDGEWTYEITNRSSILIDGYEYTNSMIKKALLGTPSESVDITGLQFKAGSNGITLNAKGNKFIGVMNDLRNRLFASLSQPEKTAANQRSQVFRVVEKNRNTTNSEFSTSGFSTSTSGANSAVKEVAFGDSIYKVIPGTNNTSNITVKQGAQSYTIYQAQLQQLYPNVQVWRNLEFRNNSQLWSNNQFVDNLNTLLTLYREL